MIGTKRLAALAFTVALLYLCQGPAHPATAGKAPAMTAIVNTVTINGGPRAVFDLVTTARLWPRWHPASRAVGGVTERPYARGDLIHETGRVGEMDFTTTWRVVEHVRPSRVVLQSQTAPARITYTFVAGKGTVTFTRKLEYANENFPSVKEVERIMRQQSEQALTQLKALIEEILDNEAKPLG